MQYSWRNGEMLVVLSSGWECKGMIMPGFMLYIVIELQESPRALYKHRSCSVVLQDNSRNWIMNCLLQEHRLVCECGVNPPLWVYLLLVHCVTVATLSTDAKSSVLKREQHTVHVSPLSPDEDTETWDSTCPCGIPGPSLPLCRS